MFARETPLSPLALWSDLTLGGPGRMEGEELGAHLAHAHVVAEGAVDDRGVIIDIKDVHSQSVLLPPGRDAAI